MIVILDSNESILEFIDDSDASIEITDTYGGYNTLDFECELTNVKHDKVLFKQGNKLLIENILFVINTEVDVDYVKNLITLEAEELVYEMNNCAPFYIQDPVYSRYVHGKTLSISKNVLNLLFDGFYTVDTTDLAEIDNNLKVVTVQGTITKYKLLKEIESATGLMFKYFYELKDNEIIKKVSLLKPEHYGVTHNKLLERVVVCENTNKLEYSTDETKNALGIMPIMKAEDSTQVNYSRILKQFYDLDINNENIMPYYANYVFSKEDIVDAAKRLYSKIESYKFIPETVSISHEQIYDMADYGYTSDTYNGTWPENQIYTLNIGMGQFLDLATQSIINVAEDYPLKSIVVPSRNVHGNLDCVFAVNEIFDLAATIQDHISRSGEINNSISTKNGLLSFQWLVYIFSEYLTTGKSVVCKTEEYPQLNKILPSSVEENINYIVDFDNYEHMPFMYTQNTSESNTIPTETPTNSNLTNVLDVSNYISETYPVLKVKKTANAKQIYIKVYSKGIADAKPVSSIINFKDVDKIQNDSEITIDYSKETIEFMKYVETTVQKEVEETVQKENPDTITCTGKNTCGCCGYPKMPYKNYTRTYKNYCPACGRSGTLVFGPKGIVDGEITCGNTGPACRNKGTVNGKPVTKSIHGCDADYCVQCFAEGNYILIRINGQYYRYVDIKELVEELFTKYDVIETLSVKPGTNKLAWKRIIKVFDNGVSDLYKVSFAHHSEIIVTGDHTFYPYSRDTKKFMTKKVKTLELKKSTLLGGIRYHLTETTGEINILAKLIGFFLGDGTFNTRAVRFGLKKEDKIKYLMDLLSELDVNYTSFNENEMTRIMFSRTGNEKIYDLLTNIYDNNKNLGNDFITPDIARGLISGLLSSDGYIRDVRNLKNTNGGFKAPEVIFSTINENILNIFVTSCSIVGIPCFIKKEVNHGGFGENPIYRVRIRVSNKISFLKSLGLRDEQKRRVNKYSDYDSAYNSQIKGVKIKNIECIGKGNVYNITVEDNHTLFTGNYCNILASNCGGDKWGGGRCRSRKLTPAEASTTETVKKTVTETVGEYKQITASNDDASADNKSSLSETITEQSSFGVYYGDVQIELAGCTFVSLKSDSCKLYELSPFPYIKKAGEQFIYAPVTKASFNYTHMTNSNPKLEPFETSEQSVEEVLIGCWKKLNGSGDNTAWLDRAEDISVDLTEENLDLNAGDFVYIKLPDSLIFKAQITEKKYNPKIKSDSSLKIGNISRESII